MVRNASDFQFPHFLAGCLQDLMYTAGFMQVTGIHVTVEKSEVGLEAAWSLELYSWSYFDWLWNTLWRPSWYFGEIERYCYVQCYIYISASPNCTYRAGSTIRSSEGSAVWEGGNKKIAGGACLDDVGNMFPKSRWQWLFKLEDEQ